MRGEEPLDEELDPRSRLREYVDSKRRVVAKKLCYARPTHRSWPLRPGSMGDISQLKDDLEQKITTACRSPECGNTKHTCCKFTTSSTDLHLQFKNDEVN